MQRDENAARISGDLRCLGTPSSLNAQNDRLRPAPPTAPFDGPHTVALYRGVNGRLSRGFPNV
jgi:hypothetical protein